MSLWSTHNERNRPLADRMRPRTLDEYVGQQHLIGPGRLLRRAIEADQLSSLLFHGPPGTGKTTLARVIAGTTRAAFTAINAVLGGVKDIRDAVEEASTRREQRGQRTLLFVDEVHRFNKAQQDALLPWVENGTVVLIGATTENPYFEVNKALVSRSRVFQLLPLQPNDLDLVVTHALSDRERGYGDRRVQITEPARAHLVDVANGDARALLNALELAVETTPPGPDGLITITLEVAEESIQQRAVLYDKEGDAHFDTISAFIKSVRGSDPDAALYWLARMVQAGEDPRFIFRRLLILASEDVGLADPQAIVQVLALAQTFDRIGLPEGRFPLAQATLYLATAPKSNSTMGFFDAIASVQREQATDIPSPLKDASRDGEGAGHGVGYLYPHAYRDHWVEQQYLPTSLQGRVFYEPSDQGYEGSVRDTLFRRREAQLAAMGEAGSAAAVEQHTFGPTDPATDRWLQRTLGAAGARHAELRDLLVEQARIARHHVVLDLCARTGLLSFEAVRRTPEGGVWAWVDTSAEAEQLTGLAKRLPELRRPTVIAGPLTNLLAAVAEVPGLRFDRALGRDLLIPHADRAALARALPDLLHPTGLFALAETLPRHAQRLAALVTTGLDPALRRAWAEAEEAIYADPHDPLTAWKADDLSALLHEAGLTTELSTRRLSHDLLVSAAMINRWFDPRPGSYADRLRQHLDAATLDAVQQATRRALLDQRVPWGSTVALITARHPR
jgi:putative ATPase